MLYPQSCLLTPNSSERHPMANFSEFVTSLSVPTPPHFELSPSGWGDILEWVEIFDFDGEEAFGDLWISPKTGEEVYQCPWLRKRPLKDTYKCRIHETKPEHCRSYPKSKKHALTTGCKRFGNDLTFEKVKGKLESIYGIPDWVRWAIYFYTPYFSTSEWFCFCEIWLVTGEWHGGGVHPRKNVS